jgi:charged multivesicular body protein 4
MFGLFGKKKDPQVDNKQLTINTLDNLSKQINELEEKIKFIETKKNNQTDIAKVKLKQGDKNGAKQALAKKKQFDDQIKQYDGAIMMLEQQRMILEQSETMKNVVDKLKQANTVLKEATKGMTVDDLDKLKDDMDEIKSTQDEMSTFFKDYSVVDNEELDEELNKLEGEMMGEGFAEAGSSKPVSNKVEAAKVPTEANKVKNDEKALEDFLN